MVLIKDFIFFTLLLLEMNLSTHTQHNSYVKELFHSKVHSCTGMIELMGQNALTRPQNGRNVEKQVIIQSLLGDLSLLTDSAT